ncbi:hypothetical protein C0995_006468 [Termitomyces sp. Mi166|nr:hypothetical protein C0995_006468 [Termitomyces sp. Mi166\
MTALFTSPYPPYDPTDKSGDCHTLSLESQKDGADQTTLDAKIAEGKTIIEKLSKLKYQMGRDHPLEPIPDDGESGIEVYNQELSRLAGLHKNTWFTAPWLYAELDDPFGTEASTSYRLMRAYCAMTTHWNTFDPFLSQKMSTFSQSGTSIRQIAASIHELEFGKSTLDNEKLAILFREMLQMCLWGNATDLSLLTHMSAVDIEHLQAVGKDAQAARQQFILKDDQEQLWKHLSSLEAGRVDFVLDNSGFELFTDLVFADFLVTYTPYVSTVYFHPKLIPWFVSDVTPPDFWQTFTSLLEPSFFPTPVGDTSAPPSESLAHMVARWKKYLEQGVFNLSVPSDTPLGGHAPAAEFWTSPWPCWNMEIHAPELFETLKKSDLVIFKGDLNYRKLVGDVRWPAWTPFQTAIGPLAGSFPLLSLRTNKADVVVGVEKGIAERLDSSASSATVIPDPIREHKRGPSNADRHVGILILGGGVAGVIAARTFHEQGIDDFLVVEARDELGGRLRSATFGGKTIELGANWIQGTQTGTGPANPILTLAKKHNVQMQFNDMYGSMTTYDDTGAVDYLDVFDASVNAFVNHTVYSGELIDFHYGSWTNFLYAGARLTQNLVDLSSRSVYNLMGVKPQDAHTKAAEYFNIDFEYAQKPDQNSGIAGSWNNNFTYDIDQGGFSDENLLSIDQRGFKAFIQEEAKTFLKSRQLRLNSTVKTISWSGSDVKIALKDGTTISADYALCTFSLGVLQNDDVRFIPELPDYKSEAIASMTMATYTKIFLKFPVKFWFNTEVGISTSAIWFPDSFYKSRWDSTLIQSVGGILYGRASTTSNSYLGQGDYSKRIEALPDSQVKGEVLDVLRSMFPNITIPTPLDFYFPRWHSDPLYRGSYSNWPPSFVKQHHDNLRSNVGRLYFAGEATSTKYYGFLHGAYFEGLDIAKSIIQCLEHKGCARLEHFDTAKNAIPYGIRIST